MMAKRALFCQRLVSSSFCRSWSPPSNIEIQDYAHQVSRMELQISRRSSSEMIASFRSNINTLKHSKYPPKISNKCIEEITFRSMTYKTKVEILILLCKIIKKHYFSCPKKMKESAISQLIWLITHVLIKRQQLSMSNQIDRSRKKMTF